MATSEASVYLNTYNFAPGNLPRIYTNDSLSSMYKLRAKINGVQYVNQWNNNGGLVDSMPGAGVYTVSLYYLQYDATGTSLLTIGPTAV